MKRLTHDALRDAGAQTDPSKSPAILRAGLFFWFACTVRSSWNAHENEDCKRHQTLETCRGGLTSGIAYGFRFCRQSHPFGPHPKRRSFKKNGPLGRRATKERHPSGPGADVALWGMCRTEIGRERVGRSRASVAYQNISPLWINHS